MAGDGRKQQPMPVWSQRVPGRNAPKAFPDPVVRVVLPGNPPGLLPRAEFDKGVEVEIGDWENLPPDDETETITLQIARVGSNEFVDVQTESFTGPISGFPKLVKIPASFLLDEANEGPFKLRYLHTNWVGTDSLSNEVPIVIDKIPPNFPSAPGKMTFDFGLGPIYDTTLDGLTEIEGTIPAWTGAAEGDQIAFTWLVDALPDDPNLIVPIGVVPGTDGKVKIPVSLITTNPDGRYCGGYTIWDKAGNRSAVSLYDLIPVALGALPVEPLDAPEVPEALDGSVDRADANTGVYVEFPRITNGKPTDEVEITWGTRPFDFRTPVGTNPGIFSIAVPQQHMKTEYGAETGEVNTPVFYTVYRGAVPFVSDIATVPVDFSMTGPENPDWPNPINPALLLPDVYGASNEKNVLIASDEDKPVRADIKLVSPLADDDSYQVYWNGKPIGQPYVIDTANDTAGDVVEIDLDWGVIRQEGNNLSMPVHYTLSNPAHKNDQESDRSEVEINFFTVTLPAAVPQNLISDRLTCRSLHFEDTKVGFQYLIPPSDYLKEGMTVAVEWKAYNTYSAPVPIPGAGKTATLGPISADEELNGVMWFVEPYDTHILPTWGSATDQTGKAEVIYKLTIGGELTTSTPSDTQVVLSAGSGTCDLTPPTP